MRAPAARRTRDRAMRPSGRRPLQGGGLGQDQRGVPKPPRAPAAVQVCWQVRPAHAQIPRVRRRPRAPRGAVPPCRGSSCEMPLTARSAHPVAQVLVREMARSRGSNRPGHPCARCLSALSCPAVRVRAEDCAVECECCRRWGSRAGGATGLGNCASWAANSTRPGCVTSKRLSWIS